MLKVVKLTYGTHGDTKEYSYLVDKDVRIGQEVQPSVKHKDSGKIFGTTGIIQHVYGGDSKGRQEAITKEDENGNRVPLALTKLVTAGEANVHPTRGAGGHFQKTGVEKTVKNADGKYAVPDDKEFVETPYIKAVREANVKNNENTQYETFAQYSARFENKEKKDEEL